MLETRWTDRQTDRHRHTRRPCAEAGGGWPWPPCEAEAAGQEVETRVQRSVCGPGLGLTWPPAWASRGEHRGGGTLPGSALCSRPVLLGCAGTWPGWLWVAETRGAGLPEGGGGHPRVPLFPPLLLLPHPQVPGFLDQWPGVLLDAREITLCPEEAGQPGEKHSFHCPTGRAGKRWQVPGGLGTVPWAHLGQPALQCRK